MGGSDTLTIFYLNFKPTLSIDIAVKKLKPVQELRAQVTLSQNLQIGTDIYSCEILILFQIIKYERGVGFFFLQMLTLKLFTMDKAKPTN